VSSAAPAPTGVWLRRADCSMLESGQLASWIAEGRLAGIASLAFDRDHPAGLSPSCVRDVRPLAQAGRPAAEILERLVVARVRSIADLLLPRYDRTSGAAGYISFELRPLPTGPAGLLLDAARRVWALVNRPNVLLQIPASAEAGLITEAAAADGLNLHIGAVGSLERFAEIADAYVRGLELRRARGQSIDHLASLVTLDVEDVDAAVQLQLDELTRHDPGAASRAAALAGRAGRALGRLAVAQARAVRSSAEFRRLVEHGARPQLPLLGGLSVDPSPAPLSPGAPDSAGGYLVALEAEALGALADGNRVEVLPESDLAAPRAVLDGLESLGVSWSSVAETIELAALRASARTHQGLLRAAERMAVRAQRELGSLLPAARETRTRLEAGEVVRRIWERDPSLWAAGGPGVGEVRSRLDWLTLPDEMPASIESFAALASEARRDGLTGAVLLGMGGSSLASDVMSRVLAGVSPAMNLTVLDSVDPEAVVRVTRRNPCRKTLFLVASKSGTTTEPLALFEHFWRRTVEKVGDRAGGHFIALTDPGTPLEKMALERRFRAVISTSPGVGGRYSALSGFGLLPAALMGIHLGELLHGGAQMMRACGPGAPGYENPGLHLGGLLAAATLAGRDKVTLLADAALVPFGDWAEQLLAESSGKEGKGIIPIVGEPPGAARLYGSDRLLVYVRSDGSLDGRAAGWVKAGIPVITLETSGDAAGLGAEFYRWEFATAVACHCLGVNAFDQPDVQRAKARTQDLLKTFARSGSIPEGQPLWNAPGLAVQGGPPIKELADVETLAEVFQLITGRVEAHEALAILLYLPPTRALDHSLARLRRSLREAGITSTVGFGPRYLHSTGQLHKGGPDRMVFLIVTADPTEDLPVPGAPYSFGVLERAQAMGDLQALLSLGRRAYALNLAGPGGASEFLRAMGAIRSRRSQAPA